MSLKNLLKLASCPPRILGFESIRWLHKGLRENVWKHIELNTSHSYCTHDWDVQGPERQYAGIPQAHTSCGTNDGTIGDVIRTSRMQPQKGSTVSVPSREELQAGKAQERCPNSTLCQSTLKFFPGSTGCGHSRLLWRWTSLPSLHPKDKPRVCQSLLGHML